MLIVVEGRLEVFKQDRWNAPRLIAVIDEGKTAGEMSMIDGEPRFATCVAADSAVIATLSREALARIVLEQPILGAKILMELVLMLSQRLRTTSQRLMNYLDKQRELQETSGGPRVRLGRVPVPTCSGTRTVRSALRQLQKAI